MNCKPGDTAIIVRGINVGALLSVIKPADGFGDLPHWWVTTLSRAKRAYTGDIAKPGEWGLIEDYRIRPLRDPGEDARDQTLEWLQVPSKELA